MSFILGNCANGGTNAVDVSTPNSGSLSGDAWTDFALGSGSTFKFSNVVARGGLSYQVTSNGTNEISARWLNLPSTSVLYVRFYVYMPVLPSASFRPFELGSMIDVSTSWSCGIRNDGKVSIRDAAGTQISVSGAALYAGRWMRIEAAVTISPTAGGSVVKLYREADSPYPTEVMTSAYTFNTQSGSNPIDVARFGMLTLIAPNYTYYLDDIVLSDTGFLGPAAPNYTPSLVWSNGGGSGTNNTLVTLGSSGSATDHFFHSVNGGGQIYHTNQSAHGGTAYRIQPTSGVKNSLVWRDLSAASLACRYYAFFTARPPAPTEISQFIVITPTYETIARIGLLTDGKLIFMDRHGVTLWTSAVATPLNAWIRVEMYAQIGASATSGTVQVAYYTFDNITAVEMFSSNSVDLNIYPIDRFIIGRLNADAFTGTFYLDDIAIEQSATGFIGTYTAPSNIYTPYAGQIPHIGWGVRL